MRYRYPITLALILSAAVGGFAVTARHHADRPAPRTASAAARTQTTSAKTTHERPSLSVKSARHAALDKLLAVLDDPGADDDAINQRMTQGYFQLVAMLRKDPSLAHYLEQRLADADREDPAARMMVGALSGSGVPEAQEAMIDLLDARRDDDSFMSLLVPSMGFAIKPTEQLQARLAQEMHGDHARTRNLSNLAMGVLASRVSDSDPDRAARIVADYDRHMTAASDPGELRTDLDALGNAGTPQAAAIARRFLDDDRPDVRARAVEALRRVETPAAETSMLDVLRNDSDEHVRESALHALSSRQATPAALDAYADMLAGQTSERLALGIVDQLGYARDRYPDRARSLLARAAAQSRSKQVRERAQALLAKNDTN